MMTQSPHSSPVSPSLSLADAIFVGLASMLGAGVFVVFAPAAKLSGALLPLAIALAGLVAFLNAGSINQLARVVTRSGGAYSYAREYLNPSFGFIAGSAFLIGKIGSAAAVSLAVATYFWPEQKILIAVGSVVVLASINILGINRTALGSWILGSITLAFLLTLILASLMQPSLGAPQIFEPVSALNVLSASALFFFAFAGYARVATLGQEVKSGTKNIPRAIAISLVAVLLVYMGLGFALQNILGSTLLSAEAPLGDLAGKVLPWLDQRAVATFAGIAGLGSLLALLAGLSRTAATMAEDLELPKILAIRGKKFGAPWLAEILLSLLIILVILVGNLVWAIGLSSFAVLVYYSVANLAAFKQPGDVAKRPKFLNALGLCLCLLLAFAVPASSLIVGVLTLALALGLRWILISRTQAGRVRDNNGEGLKP